MISALYSALLLEALNPNRTACSIMDPYGVLKTKPTPEPLTVDEPSMKRVQAFELVFGDCGSCCGIYSCCSTIIGSISSCLQDGASNELPGSASVSMLPVNSAMKSSKICPLIVVLGSDSIWNRPD